jgi:hypothetical protein
VVYVLGSIPLGGGGTRTTASCPGKCPEHEVPRRPVSYIRHPVARWLALGTHAAWYPGRPPGGGGWLGPQQRGRGSCTLVLHTPRRCFAPRFFLRIDMRLPGFARNGLNGESSAFEMGTCDPAENSGGISRQPKDGRRVLGRCGPSFALRWM